MAHPSTNLGSSARAPRAWVTALVGVVLIAFGCSAASTPTPPSAAAVPPPAQPSAPPSSVATSESPSATAVSSPPSPAASVAPQATPSPSPSPSPSAATATPRAGVPARPTGVTYADPATGTDATGMTVLTVTVRWTERDPAGVTMLVYAITSCPTKIDQAPCVLAGMKIAGKDMVLLQRVPAATGTATWTSTHEDIGGNIDQYDPTGLAYNAIVLVASNAHGSAPYVVAATAQSCFGCVY